MRIPFRLSRWPVLCLLTLAAGLLCFPNAFAQQQGASTPIHILKIAPISFWVPIGPGNIGKGPWFFAQGGTLTLKDEFSPHKNTTISWAKAIGTAPLTFMVKATERTEEIDDADGARLWSYAYDAPALTLDMAEPVQPDLHRTAALTSADGQILWTGTLTLIHDNITPPKQAGVTTEVRSYFLYQYGGGFASLLNVNGQILWSGQMVGNMGLLMKDPQGRGFQQTFGIPGPALPPGKVLTLTLTAQPGTVTLQDAAHQVLETKPVTIGYYSAAANNTASNGFFETEVNSPQTLVPGVTVALPPGFAGTFSLAYRTADGEMVKTQHTTVTWGAPFQTKDGTVKAHMTKKTVNVDASGHETEGSGMSGDELLSYSP